MKKQRVYCSYCGSEISVKSQDGKFRDYCSGCNTYYYENPLPVASTIVVNDKREVLLVKRKNDPYRDMWCLPIGFAESGEEVNEAALRELREEAGIDGEIVRLIDVDTVDNYFYGSLAIVTYEVHKTGGSEHPGDDASDARYFPIRKLPELAWKSNQKAIQIYIELYKDTWAMIDSFQQLNPEITSLETITRAGDDHKKLLSNMLIQILNTEYNEISAEWSDEIMEKLPSLRGSIDVLIQTNHKVLCTIQGNLQGEILKNDYAGYVELGKELHNEKIPLPELITIMALSRKSIWNHVIRKKIIASPLEIYVTLELNNRIIFIYDKIIYFLARGYFE